MNLFLNSKAITRFATLIISGLAILTTAQSCTFPGFGPSQNTILTYGMLKKGDPRTSSTNFIKVNAVRQLDGNVNVEGLSNISGLKLIQFNTDILFYLSHNRGLFRSDDGGYVWQRKYVIPVGSNNSDEQQRNNELSSQIAANNLLEPKDIAIDPSNDQIVYFAAIDNDIGKIYQSIDGGDTFQEIYTEVEDNVSVNFVAVDPVNTLRVYAVLDGGSLIRSLDGGVTWQKIQSFRETPIQIGFVEEFDNLLYLLFPNSGLVFSDDDGETFEAIELTKVVSQIGEDQPREGVNLGFSSNQKFGRFEKIVPIKSASERSWILLADKQIWYSENGDTAMTKIVLPLQSEQQNLLDIQPDPNSGLRKILVSIDDKLFETTNRGQSWSISDKVTQDVDQIRQILVDKRDSGIVYLVLADSSIRSR